MANEKDREALRALLSGQPTVQTFSDRRLAQMEAYGQFVATAPIHVPGTNTLAFNTGSQVPMEHVEKWDLELAGMVARVADPRLARAGRMFAHIENGEDAPASDEPTDVVPEKPTDPVEPTVSAKSTRSGASK